MNRYQPSRHYLPAGVAAVLFGGFSAWCGWNWSPAYLAAALFFASAAILLYLSRRPPIEVRETHLQVGNRSIAWIDIRRLDRIAWPSPLLVRVTLFDSSRFLLVYPGDVESASKLLTLVRRNAREALIDGKPYREFWGDASPRPVEALPTPRYRLLRPEDEAEVERLYQRLKAVRHLDPDNSGDEK